MFNIQVQGWLRGCSLRRNWIMGRYFLVWKRDTLLSCSHIGVEMGVSSYAQTGGKVSCASDAHGCVK